MAIKEANRQKLVDGNTQFSLSPKDGESIMVKDICIHNPSGARLRIEVDLTTVGEYRISGALGNHLPFPKGGVADFGSGNKTLLKYLMEKGVFTGYPIGKGETMTFTGVHQAGSVVLVTYDVGDEAEFTPEMPNGSKAGEYQFINYGNCGATISAAGSNLYNTQANDANFPNFPYNDDVPAGTVMRLHGILGSTFAPSENDGTNDIATDRLKIEKGQTFLFDEAKVGLCFEESLGTQSADQVGVGRSLIHNLSDVDMGEPLWFPEALPYNDGEELSITLVTVDAGTGANITTADHELGLIFSVEGPARG